MKGKRGITGMAEQRKPGGQKERVMGVGKYYVH